MRLLCEVLTGYGNRQAGPRALDADGRRVPCARCVGPDPCGWRRSCWSASGWRSRARRGRRAGVGRRAEPLADDIDDRHLASGDDGTDPRPPPDDDRRPPTTDTSDHGASPPIEPVEPSARRRRFVVPRARLVRHRRGLVRRGADLRPGDGSARWDRVDRGRCCSSTPTRCRSTRPDLAISSVTVDGDAAPWTTAGDELLVELPEVEGSRLAPSMSRSRTTRRTRLRSTETGFPVGWYDTDDGSYALNEPDGASAWLPVSDHPSDKATWRFEITVPEGTTAVANGELLDEIHAGDEVTWVWEELEPMTSYAILLLTGDYEVVEGAERGRCRPGARRAAVVARRARRLRGGHRGSARVLRRVVRPVSVPHVRPGDHRELPGVGDGDPGTVAVQRRRLRRHARAICSSSSSPTSSPISGSATRSARPGGRTCG